MSSSTHRKTTALRILGAAALLCTTAVGVSRAEDAHVNEMIFNVQSVNKSQINVVSEGGTRWDKIIPSDTMFWAHMMVDTRHPGYVEQVGLFLGECTNTGCAGFPIIFGDAPMQRDYNHQSNFVVTADKFLTSGLGIGPTAIGDQILNSCNQHLQPDGPTKPYSFSKLIPVSFSVNTRKAHAMGQATPPEVSSVSFGGGDHTRHGGFIVTVNCLPKPAPQTDRGPQREKREVKSIDLFLTTYLTPASHGRGPAGTQCKPLKVTTRIKTDKAGPVNVKLWRQVNGGAITHEVRAMNAAALGNGTFGADWNKFEHFNSTTHVQYKAEVLGGTFAPSTPWKDITIHCNGNFASPQNPPAPVVPTADPKRPQRPKVATPEISCAGGVVNGGQCFCRPNTKRVHAGKNAFRCMPNTTGEHKKANAKANTPTVPPRNTGAFPALPKGHRVSHQPVQRRFVR